MLTRTTRIKLVAFTVIGILAIVYSLLRFTDIGKLFGQDSYTVTAQLADSGGIFSHAEVTYRGSNVGRVGELRLAENGLEVDLNIEHGMPPIPQDLDAVVGNRSAIGEQFVDLRPRTEDGPYLEDGSVIAQDRTSTPLGTDQAIVDLDKLAQSIPHDAARTLVDESYLAFSGTGEHLQVLMDTQRDFVAGARENLPDAVQLLESGNTVLDTQNAEADSLKSFSRDLKLLSEQFKESDGDFRNLIEATPKSAKQLSEVLHETGPGLSSLVANLLTISNLQATRLDGLEQVLVSYPLLAAAPDSVLSDEGRLRLGFVTNLFDPPSCVKGYEDTNRKPGTDTSDTEPNNDAYCAEPKGSPINVRGAQNAPYNGVPVAPSEQQVEDNERRPQESMAERSTGVTDGEGSSANSLAELLGLPG
jgi:phospholipid/cholesterol/gamma-HCH transport system substrate-binding protein